MNIAYIQVVALDDRDQLLKSNIWIRQFWRNEFLTWDPIDYGGVQEIVVDKQHVWKPDLVLYNSAADSLNNQLEHHKTRIKLRYDGENIWYIPAIIISGCSINIKYFPFDYQRCELKFGSWSYSGRELQLTNTRDDIDLSSYQESSQFWLLNTKAVQNKIYYACCPDPFIDITFSVILHRQAGFYVFNVIVPSLVLTFFALFIFAYPEPTGERMGLAIQCFLTISILTMMVTDMLPVDSTVTPLLASFMLTCITAMTMSIIMNGLCANLHRNTPMPPWLHELVFKKISPHIMWESCFNGIRKHNMCNPFAICEGVFSAAVRRKIVSEKEESEETLTEVKNNLFNKIIEDASLYSTKTLVLNHHEYAAFKPKQCEDFNSLKRLTQLTLKEISNLIQENQIDVRNVQILANQVKSQVEKEKSFEFWRCFSQTVDRLCLLLFSAIYITVVIALFLHVPRGNFKL